MEKVWTDRLNRETRAFLCLLQMGLWRRIPSGCEEVFPLTEGQWETVYRLAKMQTVRGIVYQGMDLLAEAWMPSDSQLIRWVACADEIERRNQKMNRVLLALCSRFRAAGLQPVVLKGQGIAAWYGQPLLRESGDIDLYFPHAGDGERAVRLVQEAGIPVSVHADGSVNYTWQGIPVEHHPAAVDLLGPAVQPALRQLEQEGFQELALDKEAAGSIWVPAPTLNLVLLNAHILKHTLGWGIGLRQLCDLACLYDRCHQAGDAVRLQQIHRLAGTEAWSRLLHSFLVGGLGLAREAVPFAATPVSSGALWKRIFEGGNFGQYHGCKQQPAGRTWQRKWRTMLRFLGNIGFACRYAPKEAFYTFTQLTKGQLACKKNISIR